MDIIERLQVLIKEELKREEYFKDVLKKTKHGFINHSIEHDYYRLDDEKFIYAKKTDFEILSSIKVNRFAELGLEKTEKNLAMLKELKDKYCASDAEILRSLPKSYQPTDKDFANLKMMPPVKPSYNPSESPKLANELRHTTLSGVKVRSKNEAIIADALFNKQVSFSYEKALPLFSQALGRVINVYPDFTIISHGETKYWEHFGMLDDPTYADNFKNKILTYRANGIISEKNLIITMDGPQGEIDTNVIMTIIDRLE